MRGDDTEADIEVTFDEAVFGCDKVITLRNGRTGKEQSLKVHIPAGIDDGNSIRLKGKGHPGMGKAEAGDLFLRVKVGEKPGYERKGQDIYTKVNVPYTTAVLGGDVRVHTLYGDVECRIKEGTQSGTKIRLKGKGVVSKKDGKTYGDQYVTIGIEVPRHIGRNAREKLMEYRSLCKNSA
jgi:molecular chaperone DnaJ